MTRTCLLAIALFAFAVVPGSIAETDFGDHRSQTLTTRAWKALGGQDFDAALVYIGKCLELYEGEAKAMQASLSGYPPTDPPEATSKYWALNDVGTCLFIKGEVLLKRGDAPGAKAAFQKLVDEFAYAQCWDTKGWFWKPAEAARQKILELEFDEE